MEDDNPFGDPVAVSVPQTSDPLAEAEENPFADDGVADATAAVAAVAVNDDDDAAAAEPAAQASSFVTEEVDVTPAATVPAEQHDAAAPSVPARSDRASSFAEVAIKERPRASPSAAAANVPSFEVTVQDPVKKGEGMNAYTAYSIVTKTSSPTIPGGQATVSRRFNHFVWLYEKLTAKFPGVIVPPIPEKQSLNRFSEEFIGERRAALEKCLRRIVAHPSLYNAAEVTAFLTEDDFDAFIKAKKAETKKGFFSSLTEAVVQTATTTFSKFNDPDAFFTAKNTQLEVLEGQLKQLHRALDALVKQRRDMAASCGVFGDAMASLGATETHSALSAALVNFGQNESKLRELFNAQADAEAKHFEACVEEYIRIIGSVKIAFAARAKAYHAWQSAESALIKKREALEKLKANPKSASKVPVAEKEVEEAEAALAKAKQEFDDISTLLRNEVDKFDKEKFEDFHQALSEYVESLIESQKKVVAVWRDYLTEVQSL